MEDIYVKLLSYWGTDKDIANSAWVSTGKSSEDKDRPQEAIERVITTLITEEHGTPFESVWFKFYIHCPIFVERQLDKQRMTIQMQDMEQQVNTFYNYASFGRLGITQNELSGRYRTLETDYYKIPEDIKNINQKNNFNFENVYNNILSEQKNKYDEMVKELKQNYKENKITYSELKRTREVLRGILGTSFFTDMQLVLNLRSFVQLAKERLADNTQPETREVVRQMLNSLYNTDDVHYTLNALASHYTWHNYLEE